MKTITKTGVIHLNGTNVKYTITNNYINSEKNFIAHCEFSSLTKGRKNAISETGYKSHFFGLTGTDFNTMLEEEHKTIIQTLVENYVQTNGLKIRSFCFEEKPEMYEIKATQKTLF